MKRNIFYLLLAVSMIAAPSLRGQISFEAGSQVKFLKGSEAGSLPYNWNQADFDDSDWSSGPMPLRYGDGSGGTVLDDMRYNYSTVYMRAAFMAENLDELGDLILKVDYDDGFVIWINGREVYSVNAPNVLSASALATDLHESGAFESFKVDPIKAGLEEGENTLAVIGLNVDKDNSSDFLINLGIEAGAKEPVFNDTIGLSFSMPSGFYEQSFTVDIEAGMPTWNVVYTLDGSNPQDSETAIVKEGKASVLISPNFPASKPATPAVTLRASSMVPGIKASYPEGRTYIFLDEVMVQDYPGGGWPDYNVNGQIIDLEMDTEVTQSPDYKNQMEEAMTDIPSLSIITDLDNLFDPDEGIYVNAWGHGIEWERECSVELLDPEGSEGFNTNAGLRIRGGWSRHNDFPKHSFRFFFRSDYGDSKLDFPLFGEEGVDHFDKVDLRTSQNYAWAQGNDKNTMLREIFGRDLQRAMGQPYTRSRYYHLYLNGMYWGLFQTQERSEARFAADYLGGKTDDYDVIKVNTEGWSYRIEATDGNLELWDELWDMCQEGFADDEDYYLLEGKNKEGEQIPGANVLVDIDNLIDYMLTIFYTGNFDSPTSSFGGNKGPNNFYAIRNRENAARGFVFFNHDGEHSMFAEEVRPGLGIEEDRVNLTERTDGRAMNVSSFSAFHPQWLHQKMTENDEYRLRFSDRAWRYLQPGGVLTEEKNLERFMARYDEIDMAIIGESARWGDSKRGGSAPYTKATWDQEVNRVKNDFFPMRNDILIEQLEHAGIYADLIPPEISRDGVVLADGTYQVAGSFVITMRNRNGIGTTYYTLDGSDPRLPGGIPSPEATGKKDYTFDLDLAGSKLLRARIQYGDSWSPVREFSFVAAQTDYSDLVFTEIHYHPLDMPIQDDTIKSKDFEFMELKNMGIETINLSGLVLDSAIYYEFPDGELLPPGQFYVIASKPSEFFRRYGIEASGNYSKHLSNGGEKILLEDSLASPIIAFMFSDDPPWPQEADGDGNSLVSEEYSPTGHPADHSYWRASTYIGGSPFQDDPLPNWAESITYKEAEILLYPNPTTGLVRVRWPEGRVPEHAGIQIYGMNGQLVFQDTDLGDRAIHLDALGISKGVYVVKITTAEQVFRKKVVYR